jgi:hypothetical protein
MHPIPLPEPVGFHALPMHIQCHSMQVQRTKQYREAGIDGPRDRLDGPDRVRYRPLCGWVMRRSPNAWELAYARSRPGTRNPRCGRDPRCSKFLTRRLNRQHRQSRRDSPCSWAARRPPTSHRRVVAQRRCANEAQHRSEHRLGARPARSVRGLGTGNARAAGRVRLARLDVRDLQDRAGAEAVGNVGSRKPWATTTAAGPTATAATTATARTARS